MYFSFSNLKVQLAYEVLFFIKPLHNRFNCQDQAEYDK